MSEPAVPDSNDRITSEARASHTIIPADTRDPARTPSSAGTCWRHPRRTKIQTGPERLRTQYLRANVAPTELYGLSRPGQVAHRPTPWQSGHTNLVLAGDWTFTGISINSFEGAVTSGALASYALTGSPSKDDIIGYGFLRAGGGDGRPGPPILERIRASG